MHYHLVASPRHEHAHSLWQTHTHGCKHVQSSHTRWGLGSDFMNLVLPLRSAMHRGWLEPRTSWHKWGWLLPLHQACPHEEYFWIANQIPFMFHKKGMKIHIIKPVLPLKYKKNNSTTIQKIRIKSNTIFCLLTGDRYSYYLQLVLISYCLHACSMNLSQLFENPCKIMNLSAYKENRHDAFGHQKNCNMYILTCPWHRNIYL
jgi:hypothetical protein